MKNINEVVHQLKLIDNSYKMEVENLERQIDVWKGRYLREADEKEHAERLLPNRNKYYENSVIAVCRVDGKFYYEDNITTNCGVVTHADFCNAKVISVVRLSDQPLVELVTISVGEFLL